MAQQPQEVAQEPQEVAVEDRKWLYLAKPLIGWGKDRGGIVRRDSHNVAIFSELTDVDRNS